jgi:putative membrane protein
MTDVVGESSDDAAQPPMDAQTILSSNRTAMSFERTLMSADRTLMGTVRTALSLITFGFTIAQLFERLKSLAPTAVGHHSARNLGLALILLGVVILVMGIIGHERFRRRLSERRDRLYQLGLLRTDVHYHPTTTFIAAVALIGIGLMAALSLFAHFLGAVPSG